MDNSQLFLPVFILLPAQGIAESSQIIPGLLNEFCSVTFHSNQFLLTVRLIAIALLCASSLHFSHPIQRGTAEVKCVCVLLKSEGRVTEGTLNLLTNAPYFPCEVSQRLFTTSCCKKAGQTVANVYALYFKQTNKTQPKEYGVLDLFSPSLGNDISTDLFCSPIMCENSSSIQQGYTQGHSINVRGLTVNEYTFLIKKTGS